MSTTLSYVVCATPRSGSSLLCEALSFTGVAGYPNDYFWNLPFWLAQWGVTDFAGFAKGLLQEAVTANGVFGSKLMWDQVEVVCEQFASLLSLRDAAPREVLGAAFPNLHYIWLTRRDKLRQGISYYRAMETKVWRSSDIPIHGAGLIAGASPRLARADALVGLADSPTWQRKPSRSGRAPRRAAPGCAQQLSP
jgi:LPS sulfotransferase NodH